MLPAHRRPSPPTHEPRVARLAPYDRAAERRQRNLDLDLALAQVTIAAASASLAAFMYANNEDEQRDLGMPSANPANVDA